MNSDDVIVMWPRLLGTDNLTNPGAHQPMPFPLYSDQRKSDYLGLCCFNLKRLLLFISCESPELWQRKLYYSHNMRGFFFSLHPPSRLLIHQIFKLPCLVWVLLQSTVPHMQAFEGACRTWWWSLHLLLRETQTGLFECCLHADSGFRQAAVGAWATNSPGA